MVPAKQGGHQAAGLCVAICFGIGGGIIVGKQTASAAKKRPENATVRRDDDAVVPGRLYFKTADLGRSG